MTHRSQRRTPVNQTSVPPIVDAASAEPARQDIVANRQAARSFLFDLVVDLTGYDPEIIDFDADLEAELGVDSIKKAQLIGEIVQWGDLQVDTTSMQLARFETLADILALVGGGAPSANETVGVHDRLDASANCQADEGDHDIAEAPGDAAELLHRLIIDLIVDQTGYDESIIDMDADLEGELGIDSIKRAQLLGELEQHYQLQGLRESGRTLAEFPTLESIRMFVWEQISDDEKKNERSDSPAEPEVKAEPVDAVEPRDDGEPIATPAMTTQRADDAIAKPKYRMRGTSKKVIACKAVPETGTHRFCLTTHVAPRFRDMPSSPAFHGPAVVLGSNPVADAIVARWKTDPRSNNYPVHQIASGMTLELVTQKLSEIWGPGTSPHLFITTPWDAASTWAPHDFDAWSRRRDSALSIPFLVCQRWMQGLIDEGRMHQASLATLVRAGGHFGFDHDDSATDGFAVDDSTGEVSAESGGLAGLTKAMLIEAWMRGFRDTPMLVIDALPKTSPDKFVEGVWRELAVPSYDEEVVVGGADRLTTAARHQPLGNTATDALSNDLQTSGHSQTRHSQTRHSLTPGGNWIIAGGGRGITAMTAMELAARHDLRLHLLGTAPPPQIDPQIRVAAAADRADLRRKVMKQVQAKGDNPVKAWQDLEKAIEIDQTLQACAARGIAATYHSVDVSDAAAVTKLLQEIRDQFGPIRGVIQGAGAGQDARFDRKRPDKVEKCFRAKVDGAIALAAATRDDPLEWFIGFGSISGRFGANGHTDYSAANDMLAKTVGNLGRVRPETRCVTFHWHAWGDIGMATKPEAKLALDMIGLKFMPAEDGLRHFIRELELGGDASEVLITDRRYVRKFFPGGESYGIPSTSRTFPMLDPRGRKTIQNGEYNDSHVVTLDPKNDRFLNEHLVGGRPTLPFVMAIELLAEAALVGRDQHVISLEKVVAHQSLKCLTEDPFAIELVPTNDADEPPHRTSDSTRWSLVSDLRRRDGRLVQAARPHFTATIRLSDKAVTTHRCEASDLALGSPELGSTEFGSTEFGSPELGSVVGLEKVNYLSVEAPVYHGPHLQCLRQIGFDDNNGVAVGRIVAPSPAHLAGEERPLQGWVICPASMDAVLYAAGMLAYRIGMRPSLPVSFERIQIGRMPQPGEPLRAIVRVIEQLNNGLMLSAVLVGQNDDCILRIADYQISWLG